MRFSVIIDKCCKSKNKKIQSITYYDIFVIKDKKNTIIAKLMPKLLGTAMSILNINHTNSRNSFLSHCYVFTDILLSLQRVFETKTAMEHINTSVLLIYTGGTIGMMENPETGALENFNLEQLQKFIPELQKFNFRIDTYQFTPPIDSSDMEPDVWRQLVHIISKNYNLYTGFVILHGTDTMAYTASALSFMLEGLNKPVILTGSQLPIGVLRTDGKENLLTSIEIATAHHPNGKPFVPEVCIFFENHLMRGNRTTKINAEDFNAFRSFNYPVLASAGIHIKYNNVQIHAYEEVKTLQPHDQLDTNIAILKLYPGIQENVVNSLLSIEGLKAVVLETYGSGNAPHKDWLLRNLRKAYERGIVIVNVTQCNAGTVEMERYDTGYQLMHAGVVCGYDLTTESAVTKLMFLLGHNHSPEQVRQLMRISIAGEMTVM